MPTSVIGALRVNLGLDSAQFNRGASDAERRAYAMGEKIGKSIRAPIAAIGSLKGAIGTLAGALAAREFAQAAQKAFDYADAIQDLADRSGASTKAIQEFRYAAQLTGSSVETADAATEKFARTLGLAQQGSDAQVKLFRELGVTSTDFDTALRQTLDGIAKLPTVQQRAAVGFQIFGKSSATLTNLLGQGSTGFDVLAAKAQELGIVLKDDVISNAGGANDKLDTLKMILNAQFANAIVQNANSLVAVADGITRVTAAMIKFLQSNPETALALLGGVSGALAGGPIGAALGGAAGYAAGQKLRQNLENGDTRISVRREKYDAARKDFLDAKAYRDGKGGRAISVESSAKEFLNQGKLLAAARAQSAAGTPSGPARLGTLPTVGNAAGASASNSAAVEAKRLAAERTRAAEKAAADEARYQQDLARSRDDQLSAQLDLTADQTERVNIQRTILTNETEARLQEIANSKDLTAEQKRQLTIVETETGTLRARLLHRQDQEEIARQELEDVKTANGNQQELLSAQANLARTSKERGEIERKILDLQFSYLKSEQQKALDDARRRGDARGVANARANIDTIGKVQGYANAKNTRDNLNPLASYLDGIPKSADEVTEALQGIQARGLESLIDGLSDVQGGFKNLAGTVRNVADQIISSLLKIGLQKGIAALFGGLAGTPASSFSAADFTNTSSGPLLGGFTYGGARAKGGPVSPCAAGGDIILGNIW